MSRTSLAVLVAGLVAIPVGVGAFTFVYAKGFSYLSTDPRACVNRHVMNAQYDGWPKSGHRHTATCVGCHLPHAGLAKWLAKTEHGFRHSAAFTLQSQGVHARAGVACADCHRPYERAGALKVSGHWVRSPLLNLNRACQTCHAVPEKELEARVLTIQDRHHALLERAARATIDMLAAAQHQKILGEVIDHARRGQLEAERTPRRK